MISNWFQGLMPMAHHLNPLEYVTSTQHHLQPLHLPNLNVLSCAAMLTASKPEAQKRLICTPATSLSQPAAIAAVLAISPPWSANWCYTTQNNIIYFRSIEVDGDL